MLKQKLEPDEIGIHLYENGKFMGYEDVIRKPKEEIFLDTPLTPEEIKLIRSKIK